MPATCPTCGTTYADGFTYCSTDGTPLVRTATGTAPIAPPPAASGGSRNVLLGVLGALTFVLAGLVGVLLFAQANPARTGAAEAGTGDLVIGPSSIDEPAPAVEPAPGASGDQPYVEASAEIDPLPPPRQRPRPSSAVGPAVVVTDPTGLLLRRGAGRSYGVIAKMQPGEAVTVSGCSDDASGQRWCEVTYGGITGYASARYLQIGGASSDTNSRLEQAFGAASPIEASAIIDGAKVDYINVRKTPSTSGAIDLRLRPGAAITVMRCLPNGWTFGGRSITGRWCFINANQNGRSISGWASDGALLW